MQGNQKSRMASGARRLSDLLFSVLTSFLAICVLVMLVLVFSNVVLRYGFNSGINISSEIARLSFVWLIFGGSVLALRAREHLAVNMLIDRMSPQVQKIVHLVRQVVILWVLWLIIEGGWNQTLIGMSTVTPVAGMPIAVFSGAVFLSAVIMAVMIVLDFFVALGTPANSENIRVFRTSVDNIEEV